MSHSGTARINIHDTWHILTTTCDMVNWTQQAAWWPWRHGGCCPPIALSFQGIRGARSHGQPGYLPVLTILYINLSFSIDLKPLTIIGCPRSRRDDTIDLVAIYHYQTGQEIRFRSQQPCITWSQMIGGISGTQYEYLKYSVTALNHTHCHNSQNHMLCGFRELKYVKYIFKEHL